MARTNGSLIISLRKMKIKKSVKRYCPTCKKHTEMKVSIVRTKARPATKKHALSKGVRRVAYAFSGYGGSPRKTVTPVKTAKKVALKYECTVCKKSHLKRNPIRAKKSEMV